MRDIVVTLAVFSTLPLIVYRPWLGVLVFAWLSYMNPHRLAYGFASDFNFAEIVAITTILAFAVSKESKRLPITPVTVILLLFAAWVSFTTIFAINSEEAFGKWSKFMKIQAMALLTFFLINTKKRLNYLIMAIAASIAFYGVKGGLFVGLSGGSYRVFGPEQSFIADNNQLGLALIMTIPLLRFFQLQTERMWIRYGLGFTIVLTLAAILGTYSRGAFLALSVMLVLLWFRSRRRLMLGIFGVAALGVLLAALPEKWFDRMHSIGGYEEDASAMGRLDAWLLSLRVAADRPIVGGGFLVHESHDAYAKYNPSAGSWGRASHSIYFEVLGEHGWIGLTIFLALGLLSLTSCGWVRRRTRDDPELKWAYDLGSMLQVTLLGFATAGLFLNLATFDYFYHVVAAVVITRVLVEKSLAERNALHPPMRFERFGALPSAAPVPVRDKREARSASGG